MPKAFRFAVGVAICASLGSPALWAGGEGERSSRISDERVVDIDPASMPQRPRPILELGPRFLGTGTISPGVESPTGEIFAPQLVVFGTYRTAVQAFNDGTNTRSEWANSFNIFANLALSYTNRIVLGMDPLVRKGCFSGYIFDNPAPPAAQPGCRDARMDSDGVEAWNGNLHTAFMEGDFGELFPGADDDDRRALDFGFSVGRQALSFQDGLLINDSIDAIGIVRNNIPPPGASDFGVTLIYGWNNVHHNNNMETGDARLYGLFATADYYRSTLNLDLVYVTGIRSGGIETNGFYWGFSSVQRIRKIGTTFRALGSVATKEVPAPGGVAAVDDGYLLFMQANYTPAWGHNNLYMDLFWGIDHFTSAARGPAAGGALGATGILFQSYGLGNFNAFGAALGNRPDESVGGAFGYQIFSHDTRRQYIIEVGGRDRTDDTPSSSQYGLGLRFQQALGSRFVVRLDGWGADRQGFDTAWGSRVEFLTEF